MGNTQHTHQSARSNNVSTTLLLSCPGNKPNLAERYISKTKHALNQLKGAARQAAYKHPDAIFGRGLGLSMSVGPETALQGWPHNHAKTDTPAGKSFKLGVPFDAHNSQHSLNNPCIGLANPIQLAHSNIRYLG